MIGVENRPKPIINTTYWVINKEMGFRSGKLSKLIPKTIPSFIFYQLMGHVKNLPEEFWPYLQGTHVHTLDLEGYRLCQIGDVKITELAQSLQGTNVHTLVLSWNQIGDGGVSQQGHLI